ncbi:TPA: site-specific integrase [Streptococcus suis]|nr:site-specific integrase [Streptococcus suis]
MTKNYKGVNRDKKGRIYIQTEFKANPITGKRQRYKSYLNRWGKPFDTEKEAYNELCRVRAEYHDKFEYADYDISYKAFMNSVFLPYYKQTVQGLTYRTAMVHFELFIEEFGDTKLRNITPRMCEQFRVKIIANYSPNYAKQLWCRFKQSLGYAERLEYIKSFPCKSLDNPKGKRPETKFWTYEEFLKVINQFDLTDYEDHLRFVTVWLYYMTGVRVSEGFSLIWSDFNAKKKTLHVQSTLEAIGKGQYLRKLQTKTEAGKRYISLDDETVRILSEWRKIQVANSKDNYILSRFGEPMVKSTLSRMLKRYALKAGVPVITGKGLRHSHDSFMINVLHLDVVALSHRSGRIDKATTLNIYSHYYQVDNTIGGQIQEVLEQSGVAKTKSDKTVGYPTIHPTTIEG